jgi:hypothetical protein
VIESNPGENYFAGHDPVELRRCIGNLYGSPRIRGQVLGSRPYRQRSGYPKPGVIQIIIQMGQDAVSNKRDAPNC